MTRAAFQFTVTDRAGNVVPGASVEVRNETAGTPLATLYAAGTGMGRKDNPFEADEHGHVRFYADGGFYRITVTARDRTQVWRDVAIGTAQAHDADSLLETAATATRTAMDALVGGAPAALDTLNELAEALNDDEAFAATVTRQLALKANTADVTRQLAAKADTATVNTELAEQRSGQFRSHDGGTVRTRQTIAADSAFELKYALGANVTFRFADPASGRGYSKLIRIAQGSTGGRTPTFQDARGQAATATNTMPDWARRPARAWDLVAVLREETGALLVTHIAGS